MRIKHNGTNWRKFIFPVYVHNDYRNSWNLVKTTIIVIISKNGQGKTYNECEASKNAS